MPSAILLVLSAPSALAQGDPGWDPPQGIPRPTFGIVEDVSMYLDPSQRYDYADDGGTGAVVYRVANGMPFTHYVDNTDPNATDTDNPNGTPATPRRTWPYPLPEGSVVQIHGGPYNFANGPSNTLVFGGAGTAQRPIFFTSTATVPDDKPQITRDGAYNWGDYTIIENLRWMDSGTLSTRPLLKGAPVIKPVMRHLTMSGSGETSNPTAISSGGSSGSSEAFYTEGLVAWDNVMHDYGNWQADVENDGCGFILSQHCMNAWVVDNEAYHMGGDGIRLGADQGDDPSGHHYYVGRNHFHDNRENAIDIKQAEHAVLSENRMHGFRESNSSAGEAVVIHYDPNDIWFLNNEIYDTRRGFVSTGVSGDYLYLIGNRIHGTTDHAIYPDRGGGHIKVFNNTIESCASGIVISGVVDSLEIRNNLVRDVAGNYLEVADSGVRSRSTVSNELYSSSGGPVAIDWGLEYTSVADWVADAGVGVGSLEADPLLVDQAAHDHHLAEGSSAIDAGHDWTAAIEATFRASFGVGLLVDFDGDPRVVGAIDIGADEWFVDEGGTHTGAPADTAAPPHTGTAEETGRIAETGGAGETGDVDDTDGGTSDDASGGCGCSGGGASPGAALAGLALAALLSSRRGAPRARGASASRRTRAWSRCTR